MDPFEAEQGGLAFQASTEAVEAPVRRHDPVARDDDGHGVRPHRLTYGPGRGGSVGDVTRDVPVRGHLAVRDLPEPAVDSLLEVGDVAQVQRDVVEGRAKTAQVLVEGFENGCEEGWGRLL